MEIKTYECDKCGKRISQIAAFVRHYKTHNKNTTIPITKSKRFKNFDCEICFEIFDTKVRLKKHFNKNHKVKKFECKDCGKRFKEKEYLHSHSYRYGHNLNFKCFCGKLFISSRSLLIHNTLFHSSSSKRKLSTEESKNAENLLNVKKRKIE